MKNWKDKLIKVPGAAYFVDEPLAKHTSFRIGGPADLMASVESAEALEALMKAAREYEVPVTVLGGGTNVLVLEGGESC